MCGAGFKNSGDLFRRDFATFLRHESPRFCDLFASRKSAIWDLFASRRSAICDIFASRKVRDLRHESPRFETFLRPEKSAICDTKVRDLRHSLVATLKANVSKRFSLFTITKQLFYTRKFLESKLTWLTDFVVFC